MGAPKNFNAVAVIMAGGSGTRFWPASTTEKPKQYLKLFGNKTLIQNTIDRVRPLVTAAETYIVSTESQKRWLKEQASDIKNLILEPAGKNTAACLALTALEMIKKNVSRDTAMIVLPADHYIANENKFRDLLKMAIQAAVETKSLVTFGIVPTSPHTGYGYIESAETKGVAPAKRFVEKPDRKRAEEYLASGRFFWNSGIFVWTLGTIESAFKEFMPEMWKALSDAKDINAVYAKLISTAIDVGVLEKAKNVLVIPAEMGWSDVGSWDALYELREKNKEKNVVLAGDVGSFSSEGCLVNAPGKKVALIGVKDLVVIQEEDRLLVCARSEDQKVKEASNKFEGKK